MVLVHNRNKFLYQCVLGPVVTHSRNSSEEKMSFVICSFTSATFMLVWFHIFLPYLEDQHPDLTIPHVAYAYHMLPLAAIVYAYHMLPLATSICAYHTLVLATVLYASIHLHWLLLFLFITYELWLLSYMLPHISIGYYYICLSHISVGYCPICLHAVGYYFGYSVLLGPYKTWSWFIICFCFVSENFYNFRFWKVFLMSS